MCLPIWYDLKIPGDTSQADVLRTLIQLRNFARKRSFESISPIYTRSVGDLFRWPRRLSPLASHFHQRAMLLIDHEQFRSPDPNVDAQCAVIGFVAHSGRGAEPAAFGFMRPGMTAARTDWGEDDEDDLEELFDVDENDDSPDLDEEEEKDWRLNDDGDDDEDDLPDDNKWKPRKIVRNDWWMSSKCTTQYASILSADHFVACHTAIIDVLDEAVRLGVKAKVRDPFGYWRARSTKKLIASADRANGVMARLL